MKVYLDTGVLGYVTHPKEKQGAACARWLKSLLEGGAEVIVPEVCAYELRREYLRRASKLALTKLDALIGVTTYACVTSDIWTQAAHIWAQCRNSAKPLADDKALDGDVLLIATVKAAGAGSAVVATTNVGHLADHVDARLYEQIAL